jgi:radical SAM protein with 4Fe4S-binding SPASM domain
MRSCIQKGKFIENMQMEDENSVTYFLKRSCHFVSGATGAAIYDLANEKVYSINAAGKTILEAALQGYSLLSDISQKYLRKLCNLDLLTADITKSSAEEDLSMPPELNFAWLELTDKCNLRCIHCYGRFGYNCIPETQAMSVKEWKATLDVLLSLGCKNIQFIGGEPTAFAGFVELLYYARKVGMEKISVFTNGTLLDDIQLRVIKETNAEVLVSLYGPNAEIHDGISSEAGSFIRTEHTLKQLRENDVSTGICVSLMRENENFAEQIKQYIESLGYRYRGYDTIRATSDGLDQHWLSKIELLENKYKTNANFKTNERDFRINKNWNNCWFGQAAITAAGDVLPCVFARKQVVGNIRADSLEAIKEQLLSLWRITKDDIETCHDCEFRYACHDCRPLAFGLGGDVKSKNPRCCYDPYTARWAPISEVAREISMACH